LDELRIRSWQVTTSRTPSRQRCETSAAARYGCSSSWCIPDKVGLTPHQRKGSSDELWSIAQHVCDAIDELALVTVGERIQWVAGLGSTEAGPISLYWHSHVALAGNIGLLVPGVTLKLTPTDGKLEARVQSLCVTPGYWRRNDLTSGVFDDEGFL